MAALTVVAAAPLAMDPDIPLPPDNSWPAPGYDLDLVLALREHLLWLRMKGRGERLLACRRRALVRLAEHVGHDPATATYRELYVWQVHLAATSMENMRWQTALVRPYFRWLHDRGDRPDNPAALLPCPPSKRGLPRPMAEQKVMAMIATAPPRLLPWLVLAAWCGLRAAEIAGLRAEDFTLDHHGRAWCLVRGKGGTERDVAIPSWAWPHIHAAAADHGPCWRKVVGFGAVSPKLLSHLCNKYLRRIGITDTLHSLRHRAATLMLEDNPGDLRLVQDFLGHRDSKTTAIYTRVRSSRLAAAAELLPQPDPAILPALTPTGRHHLHVVDDTAPGGTA